MSLNNVFCERKVDFNDKKAIIFDFDGTLADSMGYWFSKEVQAADFDECQKIMQNKFETVIELKPYVEKMLKALKKHGIPFCIATNTKFETAKPFIQKNKLEQLYDFYVDCDELDTSKSEPDIYFECVKRFGLKQEEVIVFEDLPASIVTAKRAGFCVIGIFDEASRDDLPILRKYCDDYIYNYSQILKE